MSAGVRNRRPTAVPAHIATTTRVDADSTMSTLRVTRLDRSSGRESSRSAKPISISPAGSVQSMIASATRAATTAMWKYPTSVDACERHDRHERGPTMNRKTGGDHAGQLGKRACRLERARGQDHDHLEQAEQGRDQEDQRPRAAPRMPNQREGAGSSFLLPVEPDEHVFEPRLVDVEIARPGATPSRATGARRSRRAPPATIGRPGGGHLDARRKRRGVQWTSCANVTRTRPSRQPLHLGDGRDDRQSSAPDHRDAIADPFDLREHVRRHEHGPAACVSRRRAARRTPPGRSGRALRSARRESAPADRPGRPGRCRACASCRC